MELFLWSLLFAVVAALVMTVPQLARMLERTKAWFRGQ